MPSAEAVAALIRRVQDAFLDIPDLSMTLGQAERFFRIDRATCRALFRVLVESAVVTRTHDGSFVRFTPHHARARHAA